MTEKVVERSDSERSNNPGFRVYRTSHTRLLGAFALVLTYSDLKSFFEFHYWSSDSAGKIDLPYKTLLQEFTQDRYSKLPQYSIISEEGPDHDKEFTIEVRLGTMKVSGTGGSKKKAESSAAHLWLKKFAYDFLASKAKANTKSKKEARQTEFVIGRRVDKALKVFQVPENYDQLLAEALTHSSYNHESRQSFPENSKLAVLGSYLHQAGVAHFCASSDVLANRPNCDEFTPAFFGNATVSAEQLNRIALDCSLEELVLVGKGLRASGIGKNVMHSTLHAVSAVRFLATRPDHDVKKALWPKLLDLFESMASEGLDNQAINSMGLLQEIFQAVGMRIVPELGRQVGPDHDKVHNGKIRLVGDGAKKSMVLSGGTGSSKKTANQRLARLVIPVIEEINRDFETSIKNANRDWVKQLASFFFPCSFYSVPKPTRVVKYQLLGVRWLLSGELDQFRDWFEWMYSFIDPAESDVNNNIKVFYSTLGIRGQWNLLEDSKRLLSEIEAYVEQEEGMERLLHIRDESFYQDLIGLLSVLNLSSKPLEHTTSLSEVLAGVSLLKRGRMELEIVDPIPDFKFKEREGSISEVFLQILGSLEEPCSEEGVVVSFGPGSEGNKIRIRFEGTGVGDLLKERFAKLKNLPVIKFFTHEGLIERLSREGDHIECFLVNLDDRTTLQRVIASISSSTSAIRRETRSTLSKILHDLKNHLISAQVAVSTGGEDRTSIFRAHASASEHLDYVSRLSTQFRLVANALDEVHIEQIVISDFFRKVARRLFDSLPAGISLSVNESSSKEVLWSSADFLESIMDNLVKNSVEAMEEGGRLWLEWDADQESGDVMVRIRDEGHGVDSETLDHLLEGRSLESSKEGGSGVGMLTVVSMLKRIGGEISGTSEKGRGTEWLVLVPSLRPESDSGSADDELEMEEILTLEEKSDNE